MKRKQMTFLLVWIFMLAILLLTSYVSPGVQIIMVVAAGIVVSFFQPNITPKDPALRTPMQVLEQSSFWKGVAIVYTFCVVGIVIYHLMISRLTFFENLPYALFLPLLLGPALGPIFVCQVQIYRLLGRE